MGFVDFPIILLLAAIAHGQHIGHVYRGLMTYDSSNYVIGSVVGLSMKACGERCASRSICNFVEYQYMSKFCKLLSKVPVVISRPGFYVLQVFGEYKETNSREMSDCSDSETFNTVTGTCEGRECGFPNNHPLYDVTGNMFNFNSKVTVCEINETLLMKCNSRGEWEQIEFKTHQAWNHKLTCSEMKIRNPCLTSGVYRNKYGVSLYCDFDTDGGGWTVFQRRYDGSVDFYRTMLEYENGFGDLEMGGEFWLGLKHLAQILHKSKYDFELRVELKDWNNTEGYGLYQTFNISDRSDVYRLSVGSFSGTIGNSLNVQYPANVIHNGQRFSTKDSDNDNNVNQNCAVSYRGAWWYNACFAAHLNGEYLPDPATYERGLIWVTWRLYRDSLKETSMKIRETKMVRN